MFTALISAAQLRSLLHQAGANPQLHGAAVLVLDCSFDLSQPEQGQQLHAEAHIPGARYVHLDRDLSGAKTGRNGRHPLPEKADFLRLLAGFGLWANEANGTSNSNPETTQIVTYDRSGGMFAARAWWLCRWAGFASVAVLDGGWNAWQNLATDSEPPSAQGKEDGWDAQSAVKPSSMPLYTYAQLRQGLAGLENSGQTDSGQTVSGQADSKQTNALQVVDARSPDRFRGENETLDPVGGHIPGAVNRFFKDNLQVNGCFKSAETLRLEWQALLERSGHAQKFTQKPSSWVHQCGSGVTACHNLLAMEAAGLTGSSLYAGSWSEWCAQPNAPVVLGSNL